MAVSRRSFFGALAAAAAAPVVVKALPAPEPGPPPATESHGWYRPQQVEKVELDPEKLKLARKAELFWDSGIHAYVAHGPSFYLTGPEVIQAYKERIQAMNPNWSAPVNEVLTRVRW